MDKFSKINKVTKVEDVDNVLYSNDHMKLIDIDEWTAIVEPDSVVCIPYLIEQNQFLLRKEWIPSYKYVDGHDFHLTVISGSVEEGESIEVALIREIEEEAGLVLRGNVKLEFEKPLFVSKSSVAKYNICILPLSEKDYDEVAIKGDGSKFEDQSKTVKLDAKYISNVDASDLITEYMLIKLKTYLNVSSR